MIRVAVFLVVVGLIALAVTWFADRPGEVAVTWLGWRIETSLMVLLGRDSRGGRGRPVAVVDPARLVALAARVATALRNRATRAVSARSCAG